MWARRTGSPVRELMAVPLTLAVAAPGSTSCAGRAVDRPSSMRVRAKVGRTPSSARDPLVALLPSSAMVTPPGRRRQPGLAAPQLVLWRGMGLLARKLVDGLQVFHDAVAGLDFDLFRGVEEGLHDFLIVGVRVRGVRSERQHIDGEQTVFAGAYRFDDVLAFDGLVLIFRLHFPQLIRIAGEANYHQRAEERLSV